MSDSEVPPRPDSDQTSESPAPPNQRPDLRGKTPLDGLDLTRFLNVSSGPQDDGSDSPFPSESIPTRVGRFRLIRLLGSGGHSEVYLAQDEHLQRQVALKIPRMDRFAGQQDVALFLNEARMAAQLHHAGIVTVHDADVGPEGIYIVLEYVEGATLEQVLRHERLPFDRAIEVMLEITLAVGHAHEHGLIHRDIKPSNLLVDRQGRVRVADFGLALRQDSQAWREGEIAGTPAFMAPEQVRGESHRLDGRTDIWGLGVVLYQILTEARPFSGANEGEVHERILRRDPRPPRQIDSNIPKELERICLKCLAKRMADRYACAAELVEDLMDCRVSDAERDTRATTSHWDPDESAPSDSQRSLSRPHAFVRVIPKGLRAFDEHDADFFLALLPGPFDRDGLPECVRCWKSRIEETNAEETFFVGLLLGPSGSGKSSLIRAGLLPRLADQVLPVYLEATRNDTVSLLKRRLCKLFPGIAPSASLPEMVIQIREGNILTPGQKVLIVLDQLEQWLHAHPTPEGSELVAALRHCDGSRVQAIVTVRDDFGMAAMRLMNALELPLTEGQNYDTVDLFDLAHARRVLVHFGRAYETLPESAPLSADQDKFVTHAINSLSEAGYVAPVRLAAFAQMMRDSSWSLASLKLQGGVEGVGVSLLELSLGDLTRNPRRQMHQAAARRVLEALLPPHVSTNIKGHVKSYEQLKEVSGYADQLVFDDLLKILDTELRLITPVAPHDMATLTGDDLSDSLKNSQYQLTHDFLVPSLREWLLRKERGTRRGRARLRLAELSGVWDTHREPRNLPGPWEFVSLWWLTKPSEWNSTDRRVMHAAEVYYARRLGGWAALAAFVLVWALFVRHQSDEQRQADNSANLITTLHAAQVNEVERILTEFLPLRKWAEPRLREFIEKNSDDDPRVLVSRVALMQYEPTEFDFIKDQLCENWEPAVLLLLRRRAQPHAESFRDALWKILQDRSQSASRRLRAACALAGLDDAPSKWEQDWDDVASLLVQENAMLLGTWIEAFQPIGSCLVTPLSKIFRDPARSELERSAAANMLSAFAADQPEILLELIQVANASQFQALLPEIRRHRISLIPKLREVMNESVQAVWPEELFGFPVLDLSGREQRSRMNPVSVSPTSQEIRPSNEATRTESESAVLPDAMATGSGMTNGNALSDSERGQIAVMLDSAEGRLEESWACCWRLAMEDLAAMANRLGRDGYRPAQIRPYLAQGEALVAVLWHRDHRAWRIYEDLDPSQLRAVAAHQKENGFLTWDLALMVPNDPLQSSEDVMDEPRFLAIWFRPKAEDNLWDTKLYVHVPGAEHQQNWAPLNQHGFVPRTNLKYHDSKNTDYYTSLRWRLASPPDYHDCWNESWEDYSTARPEAWCQVDVRLAEPYEVGHDPTYSAVWWNGGNQASQTIHAASWREQLDEGDQLSQSGHRPVSLSVWSDPNQGTLVTASVWTRPLISETRKDELADRQANSAAALAQLGDEGPLWKNLTEGSDNRLRSLLIHRLRPLRFDPAQLWSQFQSETDVSIQRALLLGLATFSDDELPLDLREAMIEQIRQMIVDTEDSGLHAAGSYLLAVWRSHDDLGDRGNQPAEPISIAAIRSSPKKWYRTSEGQTMAIVEPPGTVRMGSPANEPGRDAGKERQHERTMEHDFSISMHEVTREQFLRFDPYSDLVAEYSPEGNCPVNNVTFLAAMKYCRWLSDQENLDESEMCYPPLDQIRLNMELPAGWWKRSGYRLPLESEWECASRAATVTSRHFGHTPELLKHYAWTAENSGYRSHPVGSRMPNDWGFFDVLGNVMEWTHGLEGELPRSFLRDRSQNTVLALEGMVVDRIDLEKSRITRGGAFLYQPLNARSAQRDLHKADLDRPYMGFRIARTIAIHSERP